jgi:hypothetical protein
VGRKRNSYRGNLGLQATGVISKRIFEQNFSIIPIARFTRNFHRYTRNADDSANVRQSALGALYIETPVAKKLTLSLGGSYNYGWTYQTSTRETFGFSEELSYDLDKAVTVSLGHSNDANVFAADGKANNVRLFDENTSTLYVNVRGIY